MYISMYLLTNVKNEEIFMEGLISSFSAKAVTSENKHFLSQCSFQI